MLLSDRDNAFVDAAACEANCDLDELNRMLTACQQEAGAMCALLGGLHDGVLYDLAVDPAGFSLHDCAD